MPSYGTYRITEKKCATCSYWGGEREIQFSANKPYYIKAIAGSQTCLANKNMHPNAATFCLKWRGWEKID